MHLGPRRVVPSIRLRAAGLADAYRLRRSRPELNLRDSDGAALADMLHPVFTEYVTHISNAGWAASLEASTFLYHLCRATRPRRVLDLGSGFSSYVLRRYAYEAEHDVHVTSVDADPDWLRKTHAFLDEHGVASGEIVSWEAFSRRLPEPSDVVFHDLASGDLREDAMPLAISQLSSGGAIIFDDAQHEGHRRRMSCEGERAGLRLFSLRSWTLDEIGRWAVLGI